MAEQMIDYVEAAVLRAWRHLDVYALQQRNAQWRRAPPGERGAFGVGIYGMGVMGRAVASALAARGFAVRGFARTPQSHTGVAMYSGDAGLAPFLAGAQVLVCLVPLTTATRERIDAA